MNIFSLPSLDLTTDIGRQSSYGTGLLYTWKKEKEMEQREVYAPQADIIQRVESIPLPVTVDEWEQQNIDNERLEY